MEYWDEVFLKLRNERVLHHAIEDAEEDDQWMLISIEECIAGMGASELKLRDESMIPLQKISAFHHSMNAKIPKSLIPMGNDHVIQQNSESCVYHDSANGVVFGIHQTGQQLASVNIEEALHHIAAEAERRQPDMKLVDMKVTSTEYGSIGWYEALFLKSPVPYYQIAFIQSWQNTAYMGSCQFKLEEAPLWHPLTYAVVHTAEWREWS
jgi:hypothetical protein